MDDLAGSGELLLLLLDTSLLSPQSPCNVDVSIFLQQLLIFLRAHQLLNEHHHQCIIALTPNSSPVLVTPDSCNGNPAALPELLLQHITQLLEAQASTQQAAGGSASQQQPIEQQEVALSAGLSRALCYVNRHAARYGVSARHRAKPRLLAIMSSSDLPMQYIPTMNAIFAAQASNVALDALVLGSTDSAFLQQATHLTGGLYMRASEPSGMLQYLLGAFSADTSTREVLSISAGSQVVDYRASCFCHKQIIDTGFICSVCLSIFCRAQIRAEKCLTCGVPFKKKGPDGAAKGPAAKTASPAAAAAGSGSAPAAAAAGGT